MAVNRSRFQRRKEGRMKNEGKKLVVENTYSLSWLIYKVVHSREKRADCRQCAREKK